MSIVNIIDRRKQQYRFNIVNAIVEAALHDNSCRNSDQVPTEGAGPSYDEKEHLRLADAIQWANSFSEPVTLYLYDRDGGIYAHKESA